MRIAKDLLQDVGSVSLDKGEDVVVLRLGLVIGREIAVQRRVTVEQNRGGGLLGSQDQMEGLVDGQLPGIIVGITGDAGDLRIVQAKRVSGEDFLDGTLDIECLSEED